MSQVAVISGCSSGIGRATAELLAKNGFKVYATMRNTDEISFDDDNIQTALLDVNSQESIDSAIDIILENEGKIDVLINNAGYGLIGSIEDCSIDEIKSQFETDFFGPARMIKKIVPRMRERKSGIIINISSIAGQIGFPFSSAYSSSKFALEGMTDSLRQELGEYEIKLSLIEPGVVKTKFHQNLQVATNAKSSHYKDQTELMVENAAKLFEMGIQPQEVADKILEVIKTKNPEPRYTVGTDAKLFMENKKRMSGIEFEQSIKEFFEQMMKFS